MYARETSKVSRACFYSLRFTTFSSKFIEKTGAVDKKCQKIGRFLGKNAFC